MIRRALVFPLSLFVLFVFIGTLSAEPARTASLIVDDDGFAEVSSGSPDCASTAAADANTINGALTQANSGDTIWVCPHNSAYSEIVGITQTELSLLSVDGPGATRIDASGASNTLNLQGVVNALANEVTVRGFDVINGDTHGFLTFGADTVVLENNKARMHGSDGFSVNGCGGCTLADNTAKNNGGDGFELRNGTQRTVLKNSLARSNTGNGIQVTGVATTDNRVKANRSVLNDDDGLELEGTDNTYRDNVANRNGQDGTGNGVDLRATRALLDGTTADTNTDGGVAIRAGADTNEIRDGFTRDNEVGLEVDVASGSETLHHYEIARNDTGIHVIGSTTNDTHLTLRNSNIVDNLGQTGIANHTSRIFDARKNWWGASDGPGSADTTAEDPFTGESATGSGDQIRVTADGTKTNVAFAGYLSSSSGPRTGSSGGGGSSGGSCLIQRAGVSPSSLDRLRGLRDRALGSVPGRWLTNAYYTASRTVIGLDESGERVPMESGAQSLKGVRSQ